MSHGESRPHPVDRKELSDALGSKSGNVHGWSDPLRSPTHTNVQEIHVIYR